MEQDGMAYTPMRETPYDAQEARVAKWIVDRTGIGGGDDPVGFVLASYDLKIHEMEEMRHKLVALEEILALTAKVCGRNNCNCPRSDQVKKLVNAYMERFS
jgi:hypothetical protein